MGGPEVVPVLGAECDALSAVLAALRPADFQLPTNCPPWTLAELVVHIGMSIRVSAADPPPATSTARPRPAADYYRRPERATRSYRQGNVDRTREVAATVLAGSPAAAWFEQTAQATMTALARRDPDQIVEVPRVGPMRLAEWVTTRVLSVAAHGLDVAMTLDRPPWTTAGALHLLHPVLVSLLGTAPPPQLGWNEQTLLSTGTGRRELTDDERAILGDAHRRFPLLS